MGGRIEGKVAVVTGAASGIGSAIARRFAAEGARLVLGDVNEPALADTIASIGETSPGAAAVGVACDVTDETAVEALMAAAVGRHGRLDVVVANAGAGGFAMLVDHPLEEWRRIIDLNLTGTFLTIKHAGRHLADGGVVLTVASLNAVQPSAGMAAYCAAKAGAAMLTEVAAMELGARGIRACTIAPGLVRTPASAAFWGVPGVVEEFVDNTTVGRFAEPADVANLALFLASDEASFVSGSLHLVDGGASTGRYPDLPAAIARALREHPLP